MYERPDEEEDPDQGDPGVDLHTEAGPVAPPGSGRKISSIGFSQTFSS